MKKILSLILAAAFAVAPASASPSFAGGGPLCERGAEVLSEQGAKALGCGPLCERGAEVLSEQGAKALGGEPLARPGSEKEDLVKARPMIAEKPDTCEIFGSEEAMCEQEPQAAEPFKVEDYRLADQCAFEHGKACRAEAIVWGPMRLEMAKKGVSRIHVFLSIKEDDYAIEMTSFDALGKEVKGGGITTDDIFTSTLFMLIMKVQQALKSSEVKSVNYGFVYRGNVSSAEAILRFHKRDKSSFFVKTSGESFIQGFEEIFKRTVKAYKA